VQKKAVLVIDVLVGIFQLPVKLFHEEMFLSNIEKLLVKSRSSGIPIIYIQHNGPRGSQLEKGKPGWKIHPRVAPTSRDIIIPKKHPDSFQESTLEDTINELGVNELYICGFASEFCVDTTVRSAYSKGFSVTLISDCHTTTDSEVFRARQIIDHHNHVLSRFAGIQSCDEIEFDV
jgi:nicotinamidase-related amidase